MSYIYRSINFTATFQSPNVIYTTPVSKTAIILSVNFINPLGASNTSLTAVDNRELRINRISIPLITWGQSTVDGLQQIPNIGYLKTVIVLESSETITVNSLGATSLSNTNSPTIEGTINLVEFNS